VSGDLVDPTHLRAVALAEALAKDHAEKGGDLADLFATFALFVAQEDAAIGMHCLDAVGRWFLDAVPQGARARGLA
jgi:hypothetical protein